MKKFISMLLIGSLILSITACGGKKEEPTSENASTAQITEAQTALSSEPEEVTEEPEFACNPEMYEADWEDGLVQIDDIVFDLKKEYKLEDIVNIFSSPLYQLNVLRQGESKEEEYNEEALTGPSGRLSLGVYRNNMLLVVFGFENQTDDVVALKDCDLRVIELGYSKEAPIWIANGIYPFDLTFNNIEERITSPLLKHEGGLVYSLDAQIKDSCTYYFYFSFKPSDATLKQYAISVRY